MPVLIVSLNTWPHVGFSRKRSIEPSSRVMTMPNSSGLSTGGQADRRHRAAFARGTAQIDVRSMSVITSPEMTRNVSSSSSRALPTLPAVPSGTGSSA